MQHCNVNLAYFHLKVSTKTLNNRLTHLNRDNFPGLKSNPALFCYSNPPTLCICGSICFKSKLYHPHFEYKRSIYEQDGGV